MTEESAPAPKVKCGLCCVDISLSCWHFVIIFFFHCWHFDAILMSSCYLFGVISLSFCFHVVAILSFGCHFVVTCVSSFQPSGGRFASLAAKISSWEEESKNSSGDSGSNANASKPSGPNATSKPSPFESPVARAQQRFSGSGAPTTPGAARGIQFGSRPVAPLSGSTSGGESAPTKPPRVPDSPSKNDSVSSSSSSHEPGVFHSPPRSNAFNQKPPSPSLNARPPSPSLNARPPSPSLNARPPSPSLNVRPPSPSQAKMLTTKPVSPKMKALQVRV